MPWENGRKRRFSDVLEDPYRGPTEFMEAGVRGFLVTSIPDREEHALDEAMRSLRKSCIKLYGGIKPLKREDASFSKGYVMIDFMDPETVTPLPHPDADAVAAAAAEEEQKPEETEEKEGKENEEMEQEAKQEAEKTEETAETADGAVEENKEEGGDDKEKEEMKKREESRKKRREEEEKARQLMLAPHKFQSFRTELRNIMFVKADVPDPILVAHTAFDMIVDRKPLFSDCINQMLPVLGVCDNDYRQLEIMCRRVLVPYIGEHLEEAPSFGVMLVDKMCEPGAEVLLEVVRSAIWCINPNAWQCSPWTEPDVVIHVEIIGSKIILSGMPHYMKYRQYSPFVLREMGYGKPEDEGNLLKEKKNENEGRGKKDKKDGKGKERDDKKKDQEEKKDENGEEAKDSENKEEAAQEEEIKSSETTDEKKGESKKRSSKSSGEKKSKS